MYEHVLYAYILRHTVLDGSEEAVIGFKSARAQMSKGSGQTGSAMSESTCRKKLLSLESIGAIEIVGIEHKGTRVRLVGRATFQEFSLRRRTWRNGSAWKTWTSSRSKSIDC